MASKFDTICSFLSAFLFGQKKWCVSAANNWINMAKRCRLEGCGKLVYIEPESGRVHDYCCRAHALHSKGGPSQQAESSNCSFLGCSRPKFRDPVTGVLKDFCGRTHADKAREITNGSIGSDNGLKTLRYRSVASEKRAVDIDRKHTSLQKATYQVGSLGTSLLNVSARDTLQFPHFCS